MPEVDVVNEYVVSRWESGRPMCIDIAITKSGKAVMGIEVDGGQHFRENTGFRCDFDVIQRRDLLKEKTCVKVGLPMVRVIQEDVWDAKFDWKAFLIGLVNEAVGGNLVCKVHRQQSCLYSSGRYASLRVGTTVEV